MKQEPSQSDILRKQRIRAWLSCKPVGQAFQPAIRHPELQEFTKDSLHEVYQYCRRLPHWELEGSTYFLTFRTHTSIGEVFRPYLVHAIQQWKCKPNAEGQASLVGQAFERAQSPDIASLLEESIFFGHSERYLLDAYVIMPDHVHLLLTPLSGWTLAKIQQGLKGFSSWEINRALGRKGPFWQDESFDHLIRDEADWLDKFTYIHHNPVKAGLVDHSESYPFSSLVTLHSRGRAESLLQVLAGQKVLAG
jgi:REP element-mobilizing transposase RayT